MRMRMTKTNQNILNTLLVINIGIIIFCMLSGHRNWLYTTQIGFFSSSLVIVASMVSYRNMIEKRVKNLTPLDGDDRDLLSKIDDPHGLYDDEQSKELREYSNEEFLDEVAKQKEIQKANRRSPYQVIKDSRAFLSIYRLGAYVLLILGFFYLQRHEYLHIPSYFFSLSVPPVIVVLMLMREKGNS